MPICGSGKLTCANVEMCPLAFSWRCQRWWSGGHSSTASFMTKTPKSGSQNKEENPDRLTRRQRSANLWQWQAHLCQCGTTGRKLAIGPLIVSSTGALLGGLAVLKTTSIFWSSANLEQAGASPQVSAPQAKNEWSRLRIGRGKTNAAADWQFVSSWWSFGTFFENKLAVLDEQAPPPDRRHLMLEQEWSRLRIGTGRGQAKFKKETCCLLRCPIPEFSIAKCEL